MLVHRAVPTDPAVRAAGSLFLAESTGREGTPSRRLLFAGRSPAPAAIAGRMGVAEGEELVTRRRLMLVEGVPIRLALSYFPADAPEAGELSGGDFLEGGLQELFERHGRRFGRAEETLVARLPEPWEQDLLEIGPTDPVVEIVRTSYDHLDAPVHTLQTICAAGRHVFDIGRPEGDTIF